MFSGTLVQLGMTASPHGWYFLPFVVELLQTFNSFRTSIVGKRHEMFPQFIRFVLKMTRLCARPRATKSIKTTFNEHTN